MSASPALAYDYAWLRVVPDVTTGAGEPVGVLVQCRQGGFLGLRVREDLAALAARWPGLDADLLGRALAALARVAQGGPGAAPIGLLPPSERFHWLTATRSTVLQPSAVHTGLTRDPAATLEALFARLGAPAS
ncbi:MAG: DUF3037 domain-containing protein [Rubricoccaceae bacterium]